MRGASDVSKTLPTGLSFEVSELLLALSWADTNNLRAEIRYDHGAPSEEYEEVVALFRHNSPVCRCLIWRDEEAVIVQPLVGRPQRHPTLQSALESLLPKHVVATDNIVAERWPVL